MYSHDDLSKWNGKDTLANSGKGVIPRGSTEYWDEFREHHDRTGAILEQVASDARIDFGRSYDSTIRELNAIAQDLLPGELAMQSTSGQRFDIKNTLGVEPTRGRLLNGKYGKVDPKEFGLFVTLGTYTNAAKQFTKGRANLRLIDGDELVALIQLHYEHVDSRYKGALPLKRVYIPVPNEGSDE